MKLAFTKLLDFSDRRYRLHMKEKQERQPLRRTQPVPERLGEFIELVNLLPPKPESIRALDDMAEGLGANKTILRSFFLAEHDTEADWYEHGWIKPEEERLRSPLAVAFNHVVGSLPPKVSLYVGAIKPSRIGTAIRNYKRLLEAREVLFALSSTTWTMEFIEEIPISARLVLNEQGKIEAELSDFAAALTDKDVELDRIRRCEICDRIYWAGRGTWAGRRTLSACSQKCGQTLRTRKARKKAELRGAQRGK